MKRVLIIEDEEGYQRILKDQLVSPNYEIYFAKDGKEGLALALKDHPDLIILDIVMPVMDGITMLDDLRADMDYGSKVNVIILTNLEIESGIREKAVKEHHAIYLLKSGVKMVQLDQLINDLLAGKKVTLTIEGELEDEHVDEVAA